MLIKYNQRLDKNPIFMNISICDGYHTAISYPIAHNTI